MKKMQLNFFDQQSLSKNEMKGIVGGRHEAEVWHMLCYCEPNFDDQFWVDVEAPCLDDRPSSQAIETFCNGNGGCQISTATCGWQG